MANVPLHYLHCFVDRHGHPRAYYRRDGRRVPIEGKPGSDVFRANYDAIHASFEAAGTPRALAGTFGQLVESWYESAEFRQVGDRTKAEYRRHIEPIRKIFGKGKVVGITKAVILEWRDDLAAKPVSANNAIRVIGNLFNWAVGRGLAKTNPIVGIKSLKVESEGWAPWPQAALDRFGAKSKGTSRTAFFLALFTGQRLGDVLNIQWDAITPDGIEVKQHKTKAEVCVPIHPDLKVELDRVKLEQIASAEERRQKGKPASTGFTIVQRRDGTRYTVHGFLAIWAREQARLDCRGLQFHGLRKNATVMLVEAGCEDREVAAITGHETTEMISHYSKKRDRRRLAKQAMEKVIRLSERNGN